MGGQATRLDTTNTSSLTLSHEDAEITLTVGFELVGRVVTRFSRAEVFYPEGQGIAFAVQSDGLMRKVIEGILRREDLFDGEGEFDDAYSVNGKDSEKVIELLNDDKVKELLLAHQPFSISTAGPLWFSRVPKGKQALIIHVPEIIQDQIGYLEWLRLAKFSTQECLIFSVGHSR